MKETLVTKPRAVATGLRSTRNLLRCKRPVATARGSVTLLILATLLAATATMAQKPQGDEGVLEPVVAKKDLYPSGADAKTEIDEALKKAATDKKRVMLIFGANWCYDCHVLDRALHEGDVGHIVKERFVLVHVDIGEGDKNLDLAKKYKTPLDKGVPAVAILKGDGTLLYSSGDGEFESARTMMKKDLKTFLQRWNGN